MQVICHHCQLATKYGNNLGFREECLKCRTDLHVCKNCEFYDPKAYNECRESSADVVREKDRANYCEYFSPRLTGSSADDEKAKLKAAADALFKSKSKS